MIGTLIVFGMLMIAKSRKKDQRTGWKTVVLKEKGAQNTQSKGACNFIMKILLLLGFFLGYFIIGNLIFVSDDLPSCFYLCDAFSSELRLEKIIKLLKRQ